MRNHDRRALPHHFFWSASAWVVCVQSKRVRRQILLPTSRHPTFGALFAITDIQLTAIYFRDQPNPVHSNIAIATETLNSLSNPWLECWTGEILRVQGKAVVLSEPKWMTLVLTRESTGMTFGGGKYNTSHSVGQNNK
jgi:hypothetical protein